LFKIGLTTKLISAMLKAGHPVMPSLAEVAGAKDLPQPEIRRWKMAIAVTYSPAAMTSEQYDRIVSSLDSAGAYPAPGRLVDFHHQVIRSPPRVSDQHPSRRYAPCLAHQ
jgi:hypothetical protein